MTVKEDGDIPVFQFERWSTFQKAIRISVYVKKFIDKCKKLTSRSQVTVDELDEYEDVKVVLIKYVQNTSFKEEIELLRDGKAIPKKSRLYSLTPMLDNLGVLRIKGRLEQSDLCYESAHPIILPADRFSHLIAQDYHRVMKHAGLSTVMNAIRQKYWIISLRRLVKSVTKSCVQCQRMQAPACNQEAPDLPEERVKKHYPFEVTGIDFAGPVYVSDTRVKHYICLYTCMTVRAVHLEVTSSLNCQEFMKSFRRFTARRGMPRTVYSDNAKTFVKASEQIKTFYGDQAPRWNFIAPNSPWRGGCWERMIRMVKSHLRKVVGKFTLTKNQFETLLAEIEYVINNRPLTPVRDSPEDLRPLTPANFLWNHQPVDFSTSQSTLRSMNLKNEKLKEFWNLFQESYIKSLPNLVNKFKEKGSLKEGDVVLVQDDNLGRLQWPLGRILEVIPSRDGKVRTVKIQTEKGIRTRAVQRLHLLEGIVRE